MSIQRFKNDIEFIASCDNCEYEQEMHYEWMDTVTQMKEDGWLIRKIGDEWIHLCPDCKADGVKAESLVKQTLFGFANKQPTQGSVFKVKK